MGRPPEGVRRKVSEQPDWIKRVLQPTETALRVVRPFDGEPLPGAHECAGAIVTGSWSNVTEHEEWSERTARWLRTARANGLPLFGICFGHQLMAYAFGGVVDFHPKGREIGQRELSLLEGHQQDLLLKGLPSQFRVNLTHEQTVLEPPDDARVLGRTSHDPHQILHYGASAWSVQFHPEFNRAVMGACIELRAANLKAEGWDVDSLLANLHPTDLAASLLRRFVQHVRRGAGGTDRLPAAD
jgi:GMP synthase (glutamine-hydrolysing)